MTPARHHAEWLSLVESSGPFLSMPVLLRVFPQGLDLRDPARAAALREAYEDWLERGGPLAHVHTAWIRHVLENLLEWPADYIAEGQYIPAGLEASQPHFGETLRPDLVLRRPLSGTSPGTADADTTPQLLVVTYPPARNLEKPVAGKVWKTSPATRMTELLHATGVPLGLVTNGEHWMMVYAPRGETTGFASWYADIWMQEPITLRAFHSLLCLRRFFGVAAGETLAALYAESAKDQQEVTDQLGRQVRRAVEMLVQAFDQIDVDSGRNVLAGVPEKEIYDAALTVMMRLVFLFSAEERGLLLLGDPLFDQHYAVSTLREILRERADQQGEEVLERRHDAWSRLLSTFRAVHGGVQHEAMRLPAYGGSLFNPDRYPFLEGREMKTRWCETPAHPLPVNNRVVLHLLEALQLLRVRVPGGGPAETRRISFRALDVEQIGHVYEGLLDHTARRATEVTLGLDGKNEPEVPLAKLEELAGIRPATPEEILSDERKVADDGTTIVGFPTHPVNYGQAPAALIDFLTDSTGRSAKTLESALGYGPPKARGKGRANAPSGPAASSSIIHDLRSTIPDHSLLLACGQDPRLARRLQPFASLLRADDFGRLAVIRPASVFVTAGTDRRSSGTHYTPPSLTIPIVKHTLEPLVYIGPAEGLPEVEWKLRSPKEILALKICDLSMGSGALLVQVCRYLAERLCEAWELAEKEHDGSILITPDGEFSTGSTGERLLPNDPAERVALARRYVADRCLYGVDINPMAVEMAKLSLWLITLQKDRPFTFLDHALKCGDSLLGVGSVQQIENFSLRPGDRQVTFATSNLFRYVDEASAKRRALEELPSNDHTQIETKNRLHAEAEAATAKVKAVADCLIAFEMRGLDGNAYEEQRAEEAEKVQMLIKRDADASLNPVSNIQSGLANHARVNLRGQRTFHWAVDFPEVFARGGFDAFVGNPPFVGGKKITGIVGVEYRNWIVRHLASSEKGAADLSAYFLLRAHSLTRSVGVHGLIATNAIADGDTERVGLRQIVNTSGHICRAYTSIQWPGEAGVVVAVIWWSKTDWAGPHLLDEVEVPGISSRLAPIRKSEVDAHPLRVSCCTSFAGTYVNGEGFVLSEDEAAKLLLDSKNHEVVLRYLIGDDINSQLCQLAPRWVIDFKTMLRGEAEQYEECFEILTKIVKPYRDTLTKQIHEADYWKFWDKRIESYREIANFRRVLVAARASKYVQLSWVKNGQIFSDQVVVFITECDGVFACLQSTIHGDWAWERCTGMWGAGIRYAPSKAVTTFALPEIGASLKEVGKRYFEARVQVESERSESLTSVYNHFHDRGEQSADIERLRMLHVEMDQAVAAAYGWSDLDLGHGFHATKQGERYTLSEPARRTVLDRLLALNHQRYAEELAAGLHEKKSKKTAAAKDTTKRTTKKSKGYEPQPALFPSAQPDLFG